MAVLHSADQDLLHKLLLGQLPTAEVERLATEYADDRRLAELAESVAGNDDALLDLLQNRETAVVDSEGERLVERLLERLKPALPAKPRDDTAAMNKADATTEPSSPNLTAPPPMLPERLEYYRPIKVLGQGGMGTVYLAEDTRLGREVAIKTLRPELAINPQAKERFLREARTAAKLEHDHIIPIYSVGEADGTPFLAMPLLKGEPLDALIRRTGGPLPVAAVIRIAREAASGLGAAHERGLIHRDIKPANIWLEAPTGRVKILDFGLAKAADAGGSGTDSETHLTASGAIVGTPAYMAPEQASGHAVDGRADLFSLGCVLYELLSGKRAFSGPNTMSILMSLANHTPTAPDKLSSQCPAALSRLVMQLLEKDPANRPASAEAVIDALDNLDIASVQANGAASAPWSSTEIATTRGLTPPRSPTHVDHTQLNTSHPSDSGLTLPATAVMPVRKRVIPTPRVALALAGVLLMLLAAVVYRIQTDQGTLVVEVNDDDVEAKLKKDGLEVRDTTSGRSFTIRTDGSRREASGDFKVVDGQELKLVVLDADGLELTTNEFKLVRNGKLRVSVRAETNGAASTPSPKSLAADRRAAEWLISIGGRFRIKTNHQVGVLEAATKLPDEAFELTDVDVQSNPKVNDAGLAHLQDCKNLTNIWLNFTKVSNAGLAHLKGCKNLTILALPYTEVSDLGLTHFQGFENLGNLGLTGTKISDAGLAYVQTHKNLLHIELQETEISDTGLERLSTLPKLRFLRVAKTKVTEAGVKKLSAALPGCRIEWDGGVIEPTVSPDRRAAEYVLSIGGRVDIDGSHAGRFSDVANLPQEPFRLTQVSLPGNSKMTDTGLAVFRDCKNLEYLQLNGTSVSDAGLAHFQNCKNLKSLLLDYCSKLTDAGLCHFKDCKNLEDLRLSITAIGDEGLANFQGCPNLTILMIAETQATDAGLAYFQDCQKLLQLEVSGKGITDAGLSHFQKCRDLNRLAIQSCDRVTDAGLAHFQNCKKLTHLNLGALPISDAGLVHFKNCPNLHQLWLGDCNKITDAGLVHFQDCSNLGSLDLRNTSTTDEGLAYFAACPNLTHLSLGGTKITNAGLAHFAACTKLREVQLSNNRQVSTAALAHFRASPDITNFALDLRDIGDDDLVLFRDWKKLTTLGLGASSVTDAGLNHLKECKNLTLLRLRQSKITATGVDDLKQALPNCRIEWDGGVVEPSKSDKPN